MTRFTPFRTDRRQLLRQALAGLATLPLARLGQAAGAAAAWPSQPVKVLVGFPGGSSPDLTARLLVEYLAPVLSAQPVIVENRSGAGGNIAAAALARASDQHTISVMINGNMTIARLLNPKLGFDPLTDLAPIALIGSAPYVLTANAQLAQGLEPAQFLDKARQAGDRWNYGSPGLGTVAHLGMELLKSRTGIAPLHVPYQGNPQALQAVISGEIQMSLLPPAMALAQQKAGRVALIGITSATRSALTGNLPSLQELGAKGLDLEVWNAVAAPATLPPEIQARLREAVTEALAIPEARQKLLEQGWVVGDTSAKALRDRIAADTEALGTIIREQHIRIDS
ncbi:tripartite tricarboxylate transporter substrate binding protein [Corticibacter populi]|uniref:Tripartite tricarboxylate transporter substrate binding protein n=1 Tax=Corticibacter populi TaxID=1550736 RepID=A0A3M6QSM9_9BURK|nr:tripartite tricarboxylate transporter substrate binding protein [Corticibacter populi]RMX06040.1 tripartite tricarboxylate transporter substrate binding protein [Corticibacter populi]